MCSMGIIWGQMVSWWGWVGEVLHQIGSNGLHTMIDTNTNSIPILGGGGGFPAHYFCVNYPDCNPGVILP